MNKIITSDDKIQKGDFIIDLEKRGVTINNESEFTVVKCVKILDNYDLVWTSLDGKSMSCDSIEQFRKVVSF